MYNAEKDTYVCDFCGFETSWESRDELHGEIWFCEKFKCEKCFCSKCFIDKFGKEVYFDMMQNSPIILCPDCYEENKGDIL